VTVGLELGVDQLVSNRDLEPASVRRDQGQVPDIILELFQQFIRQAHGPVGVVSYGAVDDLDVFKHWVVHSKDTLLVEYRETVYTCTALHSPHRAALRGRCDAVQVSRPTVILKIQICGLDTTAENHRRLLDHQMKMLENYNMHTPETCHRYNEGL